MKDRDRLEHAGLAVRARAGDRRAFTELIEQTKFPLYRFIRRYVGNEDDAYDIVQETFIAAWGALHRYDESRSLLTWLRSIALNKCRDHARRQAVRTKLRTLFAFTMLDREESFEERDTDSGAHLSRLDAAIAELPPFYKEPLLLTAISGLSHKEAAVQLNTSSKAIEMRVRRARQRLEKALSYPPEESES